MKLVFGGASLSEWAYFKTHEEQEEVVDVLLANGVKNIDTARLYTGSEKAIGQCAKRTQFTIDTKWIGGFAPGTITKDAAIADAKDSLKTVDIDQFDIFYIHAPDASIPIEETLAGVDQAHKAGIFRRFGLSNYAAEDVEKIYNHCKEKGYVVPSVYQGQYNPVARHLETTLFPTLRRLNMSFYAYSPLAGGFLTKTPADIDAGAGRFNTETLNGVYKAMYDKPRLRDSLLLWNEVAEKEGVAKAELAYRWVAYHSVLDESKGDAVIFGASKLAQVEPTIGSLRKGPLSEEAREAIERIWESVKEDAPGNDYVSK